MSNRFQSKNQKQKFICTSSNSRNGKVEMNCTPVEKPRAHRRLVNHSSKYEYVDPNDSNKRTMIEYDQVPANYLAW